MKTKDSDRKPALNKLWLAGIVVTIVVVAIAIIAISNGEDEDDSNGSSFDNSNTPLPDAAIPLAENGVSSNAEWEPYAPYIQEFNDVEMVLVPAGCFMMGSIDYSDEQPIHQQCFDEPFWIDRTEVTRTQYNDCVATGSCTTPPSSDYSTRDAQPINNITWFQARDYCAWRDARLPTEREWEYAARGPDNLTYPWGNNFISSNVVYSGNANGVTANVGSRPDGASWVGALDMSGNVWEWVSSLYRDYDYNATDGREDMDNSTDVRVLRGGSFFSYNDNLRAADRDWFFPYGGYYDFGFRCARSY